jgi:glycosyltransferase involved in cell wall biosynthesis
MRCKGGPIRTAQNRGAVPCYNEEATITKVVEDFRAALPAAEIFVFDNSSTDNTGSVASASGAVVFLETHRGKGFVVRRMFSDVEWTCMYW